MQSNSMASQMNIRLQDASGSKFKWNVVRDANKPAAWVLTDHTGYKRVLDEFWATSVPRIKLIAENHGLTLLQEVS